MSLTLPTIFKAIDKISAPMRKMGKSINGFSKKSEADLARLQRRMRGVSKTAGKISRNTAVMGLAIVAPLALATNQAMAFEKQMSNVATIIDTNTESIGDMSDKVLEMATRLPVSVEDLTASLYDVRSAGIPASEAMDTLEASAKLSAAGLSSASEATNILTSATNAFAKEGLTANEISDILFKTVKAGKTTISELSQGFGASAGIIESAGIKLADFQAATAALTTVGTPAVQAQTQLTAAISSLKKPSSEMEKIFKKLGVTSDKEIIKKFGGVGGAFEAVNKAGSEMGVNLAKAWGKVQAAAAVTSLTGATNEAYLKTLDDMSNGANAVEDAFNKQLGTGAAQAQIAKNNMQALSITIGTTLIPVFNQLVKQITPFITKFMEWSRENPKALTRIVKVAAAIGGLLLAVSAISKVIQIATGAQWLWNIAMAANPVGLVIAGVAALIGLIVLVAKKWDKWGAAIGVFLGPLGLVISLIKSFRKNWDMIKKSFADGGILKGFKAIGAVILDAILFPLQKVLEVIGRVPGMKFAGRAAGSIEDLRARMGVETTPAINPKQTQQDYVTQRNESTQNKNVTFDFQNMPDWMKMSGDGVEESLMPNLSPTLSF